MATYTKKLLSGSTNGKQVKVVRTATEGTLIHTAVAGTTDIDEIWLYAVNNHSSDVQITIEWGGVASPDDLVQTTIPFKKGKFLIVAGEPLQNGLKVTVFASVANVVSVSGWVNRITG